MKKLFLAICLICPTLQASEIKPFLDQDDALLLSDPYFNDDYKALNLCVKLSANRYRERFSDISKELSKIDPIYHSNSNSFDVRATQFSQLGKSVIGEYELLCNRFAKSSTHISNHDLAMNMFKNRQFLVSTSFALLIQELKLNDRLYEARDTIEMFAENKIPHAVIMKAGFLLEEGKTEQAIVLAKETAKDGLAIAHITLSAINEELGNRVKAYAWLYVGLDGVVRSNSVLFDKLRSLDEDLSEEDRIHALLMIDEIKKTYPLKELAH